MWPAALTLALAGAFAGYEISTWPAKLRYPGEESLAEGPRLAEMVHLREGRRIYDPPSLEGFDASIHGPLYLLLGSRIVDPRAPSFLGPRLLSLLATLGCAAACAVFAWRLSSSSFAALLAPLIFLSFRFVTFQGVSDRCDTGGLVLSISGFIVAWRFRRRSALLWAVPLIVLAFFYKQQFVAVPVAIVIGLSLEKRYRLAAALAGLGALGGLILLGIFQFGVFRGQAFLNHFVLYNRDPLLPSRLVSGAVFAGALFLFPLFVALEYLRLHRDKFLGCYLVCATALSMVAFARQGSDTNYFLEPALLLSAIFAALLGERITQPGRAAELIALLAVSLLLAQLFALPAPSRADFERDGALQAFLRRNFRPGTPALGYYTGDLLRAGLDTPVSDLYTYSLRIRQGILPDREILAQLQQRRFGVIVLNFDLARGRDPYRANYYLTGRLRDAIAANYQPAASLKMPEAEKLQPEDRFYVWVPRLEDVTTPDSTGRFGENQISPAPPVRNAAESWRSSRAARRLAYSRLTALMRPEILIEPRPYIADGGSR